MRTFEEIRRDITALRRPVCPGAVGIIDPGAHAQWKSEREAWRTANPGAEERYCLLLEEIEAVEDAKLRQQKRRSLGRDAGIPPLVLEDLAKLERLPVIEAVDAWLASPKGWLVLGGTIGTGKSVAAGYALTQSIAARKRGAWMSSSGFAAKVGGFSGVAEAERLKHIDVLVLDDFGTEHLNSFTEALFFEVLSARHENGVRTVITHNLDKPVLRQRLGSRLADRVVSSCAYVECSGESMRRKS